MKKLMFMAVLISGLSVSAKAQSVIVTGGAPVVYAQPVVYNAPVVYNTVINNNTSSGSCRKVVYCGASSSCCNMVYVPNVSVIRFGCGQAQQQGYRFRGRR